MSDELRAELRAAAERVNEYLNGGGPSLAYPKFGPAGAREAFEAESSMLARAYLAQHPADDAEPVTEEWLASSINSGELKGRHAVGLGYYFEGFGVQVRVYRVREMLYTDILQDDDNIAIGKIKTRGDLRLLCRALQIPLKEP